MFALASKVVVTTRNIAITNANNNFYYLLADGRSPLNCKCTMEQQSNVFSTYTIRVQARELLFASLNVKLLMVAHGN